MQEYVKPNMILPISLHDARLSSIRVESDMIIFVMEDGIRTIDGNQVEQIGKAMVSFPKADFDFCRIYCTGRDNHRKEWDIRDFTTKLQAGVFIIDIIDETYGYNQAKFVCNMTVNHEWFACDIEIYHFGLIKYNWEST
ncbi:hypothetical protein SDC9_22342 [bioreactor metagenome]|uniref:Uncharacterized protein n=1 Tax=bioreactor metagenome TaxID=1076179 RepID=A0A644UC51_9ZZZZ|nr:hypothetical protein [Desulfitobacterium hafniense]MEA5023616.1 hypothetical protein [Desulfitobacterium hafniense]